MTYSPSRKALIISPLFLFPSLLPTPSKSNLHPPTSSAFATSLPLAAEKTLAKLCSAGCQGKTHTHEDLCGAPHFPLHPLPHSISSSSLLLVASICTLFPAFFSLSHPSTNLPFICLPLQWNLLFTLFISSLSPQQEPKPDYIILLSSTVTSQ